MVNQRLKEAYENVYSGWWPILEKAVSQILAIDPEADIEVKEKLGTLRIWAGSEKVNWDEFSDIILKAEKESQSVCEICGNPGQLRTKERWMQTLCDQCAAMPRDERYRAGYMSKEKLLAEMENDDLIRSVSGSMALSGFELTPEDIKRIRRVVEDPTATEQTVQQLMEKHITKTGCLED